MMHTTQALYDDMNKTLHDVNLLIEHTTKNLQSSIDEAVGYGKVRVDVHKIVDGNGNSPLAPMLLAKAQLLSGMAALKAADVNAKAATQRKR